MNLIIDFDSTICKLEGLDELATIVQKNNWDKNISEEIEEITNLGMSGQINFEESLTRRLKLLEFDKNDLDELIKVLKLNLTSSFIEKAAELLKISDNFFVISGGFLDFIYPVLEDFEIKKENIFANEFIFNENGKFVKHNRDNPLAHPGGKITVVDNLVKSGSNIVVGDGFPDHEIKISGAADYFIAFVGNQKRDNVVENADYVCNNFDEVLEVLKKINQ
ncbi:MAG: HAD-IB family phosphatase [Candidatus Dojkabacteria bacterium]|nr:HAD-IB family phosphatase [Candidatus Dojkabacteria bacterium]MDQ7021786.1 HAD-IB family phosphatase [Candidatus Dojkabacteria bacterium]